MSKKPVFGPFPPVTIADKPVNFVLKSKCLGVTIDSDLSWHDHTNDVCSKFNAKVKMLKRMKSLPSHSLEAFYLSTNSQCYVWNMCVG